MVNPFGCECPCAPQDTPQHLEGCTAVEIATPELAWTARAVVPFDWGWSKNKMWLAKAGGYGRRLNPAARDRRTLLAASFDRQFRPPLPRVPLWVSIRVSIPDRRGDAVNCVDLVLDAVQEATGLDDRWYKLAGLDWELDRNEPRLDVRIGQEVGQ